MTSLLKLFVPAVIIDTLLHGWSLFNSQYLQETSFLELSSSWKLLNFRHEAQGLIWTQVVQDIFEPGGSGFENLLYLVFFIYFFGYLLEASV